MRDAGSDPFERLKSSSRNVRRHRRTGDRARAIVEVDEALRGAPDDRLRPVWRRWQIDDAAALGDTREALERVDAFVGEFGDVRFAGETWSSRVGPAEVRLHDRAGDPDEALSRCRELARRWPDTFDAASCLLDLGRSAERRGDRGAALELYEAATRTRRPRARGPHPQDLAAGLHTRLRTGAPWARATVDDLRSELTRAVRSLDAGALGALASGGNFSFGERLGEPFLVPGDRLAGWLAEALRATKGRVELTERTDDSGMVWVGLDGLAGSGVESVELGITVRGDKAEWEWAVVPGPVKADALGDLNSYLEGCAAERTSSPPVVLPLKAPWPAGMTLSAGGVNGGFYYNTAPTHCDEDSFAIDFANGLFTHGTPVLAAHQGIVTSTRSDIADFDDLTANIVYCDLVPDEGAAIVALQLIFGGDVSRTRYSARYYHLRGPDLVPVSEGMWVDLGTQLGEIDSTGRSAAPHLHFALHDEDFDGHTVMPTPMDGATLGLDDAGTWITSTNEPEP